MAFGLIVPPGTTNLATIDPVVLTTGTDPGTWQFHEGTQEISDGTDLSARPEQTSVYIHEHAQVRFTSPFRLGISTEFIVKATGGLLQIQASDTGDDTIAKFILDGGMEVVDIGGGIWSDTQINRGTITMSGSTAMTSYSQTGGTSTINYSATGLSSLFALGGVCYCRRGMATNSTAIIGGNARVRFARAQTIASSGITNTGGSGVMRIGGSAQVDWRGGVIDALHLDSPNARWFWQSMPAAATIPLISGSADAIDAIGIRPGAENVLKNGAILTVTSVVRKGSKTISIGSGIDAMPS